MKKLLLQTMAITAALSLSLTVSAQTFIEFPDSSLYKKDGPMVKVGRALSKLYNEHQNFQAAGGIKVLGAFQPSNKLLQVGDGFVVIDAVASGDPTALRADLEDLGLIKTATFGIVVSGWLPILAIDDMAALDSLRFIRPSYAVKNSGLVDSQGDAAMRSDLARSSLGIDGTGITVGVLSDSYNCLGGASTDIANSELPPGVVVLDDSLCPSGTDEGRAVMQIIHDVAPGASQAFHTASGGQANFAQGINELANLGAKIIVDDIIYTNEPMFQDGIIARAVDSVVGQGVAYYSTAGNWARASYESNFRGALFDTLLLHDFDPGPGVDHFQSITIPEGTGVIVAFQWDEPFFSVTPGSGGSRSDLDIGLLNDPPTTLLAGSADFNIGADPWEAFLYFNPPGSGRTFFNLVIENFEGPNPNRIKYILLFFEGSINEFNTYSSTIYGHANATGAEAVGAAFYARTPEFGWTPPLLEGFSSLGGTPILFDGSGSRLSTPIVRMKPEIVAPDGVNTTFFGGSDYENDSYPNFFGTSASAAHSAGVAALMREYKPIWSPARVYKALEQTAIDMDDPFTVGFDTGFDFASGYGLIQADAALAFPTFADVPKSHWAFNHIEKLYQLRFTGGCGSENYCPGRNVTRAEMAVFLERLLKHFIGISNFVPPPASGIFNDVPTTYWAAAWIEELYRDGITSGCGGGNFCPNSFVSRDQMAVFLERVLKGSDYIPPPASGIFSDVPTTHWAAKWIEALYLDGITVGCGGGRYCPDSPVNRAQTAVFLVRTEEAD